MLISSFIKRMSILLAVMWLGSAGIVSADDHDHREFEATLHVPFRWDSATPLATTAASTLTSKSAKKNAERFFTMDFEFQQVERPQLVAWRLELVNRDDQVLKTWHGTEPLFAKSVTVKVPWSGIVNGAALPDGQYRVRMLASANDATAMASKRKLSSRAELVNDILSDADNAEVVDQTWSIMIGNPPTPAMPSFNALPTNPLNKISAANKIDSNNSTASKAKPAEKNVAASQPALNALPYTVYYGNLHSQTNHSDGGGDVATCKDSQNPQAGPFGPTDAYRYAADRGLDFLMTSEHNHLFDGSTGTNASANAAAVKGLYQSGLAAANSFNQANANFLGIYGMEWGVINNGGHLNIFNSDELLGWESNSANELLADTFTAKGDYAALYTLMQQRGLVGQFNHPASSGQFVANGVALGYTPEGDNVMALCEVLNTSAFSSNTTETETSRSTYESACQKLLEAGFHIAFTTDQDNHCANWGASYTNRTGVLLANGTALNRTNFVNALKARRVFATMDKESQLILTANGRLMGERIANTGPLTLIANFANSSGRTVASVQMLEGVPGRNGVVTTLSNAATTTITPSIGEHFYYAKVTQDDGKILWSAPIWVTQADAIADTVAPTVSANEVGSTGTVTLSASASDNVGVTNVEFYVDGVLKGSSTTAPYSVPLDSNTLANGTHNLVAKAFDAAGNSASSAPLNFSVNNAPAVVEFVETEANGTISSANTVARNFTSIRGTMGSTTDKDFFKITLNAAETITVNMTGPTGKDYDLYLVDAAGATLTSSTGSTTTERITYKNGTATKVVYLKVIAYTGSSTTVPYILRLTYQ